MALLTIGEFAERTRLSPKALRIYDELGLVVPAEVDPASGYRFYDEVQIERARVVGMLRRLDMSLATIGELLALDGPEAAAFLGGWWGQIVASAVERNALVEYLQARFKGEHPIMREINVRTIPERRVASISRHVTIGETDAFFHDAFGRLRALGPGLEGIEGAPFLIFYGEVNDDSDGPMELCRPVQLTTSNLSVPRGSDIELRLESEHEEAYVRLSQAEMAWPAMLPFCDALERWARTNNRQPSSPMRQVLIADRRTADPSTPVCDLSVPLH